MNNKKGLTWIINILLMITVISGGLLLSYAYSLRQAHQEFNDLAKAFQEGQMKGKELSKEELKLSTTKKDSPKENTVSVEATAAADAEEEREMIIAFEALYEKNNDIVGWISIGGTNINYPVMYTPNNPEYYLHRNFNKEYSLSGVPFIDAKSSIEPRSNNILIHGHNMKDGSMFAQLLRYKDKAFLEENPTIVFYTFSKKEIYDIMAVSPAEVYNDKYAKFNYHHFSGEIDEDEFDRYVAKAKEVSLFETGIEAAYGDRLLTLSTCAYHTAHGRFVMIAKARDSK